MDGRRSSGEGRREWLRGPTRDVFSSVLPHVRYYALKKLGATLELRQLALGQAINGGCEFLHSARAAGGENLLSLAGGRDKRQPAIAQISSASHEAILLETGHDAGHRRRAHLLGAGEIAERKWSAE